MILVIKQGHGDCGDYHENIIKILDVRTTKTIDELRQDHLDFLIALMATNNIPHYPGQPHAPGSFKNGTWCVSGSLKRSGVIGRHKKLYNDNNFLVWLGNNYTYTEIPEFFEVTI